MKHTIGDMVEVITGRHGKHQKGIIGVVVENDIYPNSIGSLLLTHCVEFTLEGLNGKSFLPRRNQYAYEDLQVIMKSYDPTQVGDTDEDI